MEVADTGKTYGLEDLEAHEFPGTPLAVVGSPIRHSVSPAMHNAAIERLAGDRSRFSDWAYYRFEIAPELLPQALELFHRRSFLGLNLTVPHKVEAMDLIKGVSPDAARMGAVNTLVWDEFGYDGFNTDGYGLEAGLRDDLGVDLKGANVLLLGAGGAARAAAVQCLLRGVASLRIANRSSERLDALLSHLGEMREEVEAQAWLPDGGEDLPEKGVLINATSLGLKTADPMPIPLERIPRDWCVYDMIYNPTETQLLAAAAKRGMPCANGLSMLVHQGARSLEIWSHQKVDARVMMTAACHQLGLPPRVSV